MVNNFFHRNELAFFSGVKELQAKVFRGALFILILFLSCSSESQYISKSGIPFIHINKGQLYKMPDDTKKEEVIKIDISYAISKFEITNEEFVSVLTQDKFYIGVGGRTFCYKPWGIVVVPLTNSDRIFQTGIKEEGDWIAVIPGKESYPVHGVTFAGALAFSNELSLKDGLTPVYVYRDENIEINPDADGYRIPKEIEWEYAAYADSKNIYPWGNKITNEYVNSSEREESLYAPTTPVGFFDGKNNISTKNNSSPFGVYDMIGNVAEWCWGKNEIISIYDSIYGRNILRGGSYMKRLASLNRSANREEVGGFPHWAGIRIVKYLYE